eukprot:270675-Pelagomonas_calceolata.AAC.1
MDAPLDVQEHQMPHCRHAVRDGPCAITRVSKSGTQSWTLPPVMDVPPDAQEHQVPHCRHAVCDGPCAITR